MNPILDEVAKTSIQLMLKEPFYGHFFTSVLKDISEKTKSVATTVTNKQMIKLIVNQDYWNKQLKGANEDSTKKLRYGAIKHQILHIVFKHILRVNEFGNKKLFGIAADITNNQYINSDQLTGDAIRLEDFPEFKLERGKGVDYYYKKLADELNKMPQSSMGASGAGGAGEDDEESEGGEGNGEGNGTDSPLNQAQQRLKELLESEDHEHLDQHDFWDDFDKMSSAERKMMDTLINDSLINCVNRLKNKMHGTLPAGLQQYIDLLVDSLKPNVNWRRVLRLFTASSSRTRLKNTIRRPSKRYGTTPGIKIKRKQKILIAIDTSGSVSNDELREFFSELYYIWKQGAEIYVVECDTHIHNQYFYNGKPPAKISGRGGTDFNAPLAFANDEYMPDAIVYFTDGYASAPSVISRKPILWMVTSQGIDEGAWDFLPGRKVKMVKQLA
ncbi:MAG: VWA-like domain-containing protein [Saprospiraceae bacterium]|nr:VWA-like domain-containing protein [Saprospiraceae bacterium]